MWTDADRIAYVGPERGGERPAFEREIDLGGSLVIPGFKNAHTHSAMTFLRSYADDLPLLRWLNEKVFPLEARLTPERVYAFTRLAVLEYLSSGITASFDMYFHRDAYAQANIDMGFRTVMCGALSDGDSVQVRRTTTQSSTSCTRSSATCPGCTPSTRRGTRWQGALRARARAARPLLDARLGDGERDEGRV